MHLDENEFFREATLRICGSVEIEKALWACVKYIGTFTNVDSVYLHYIKLEQKRGTVLAMADQEGGKQLNIRFDHPAPIWRYIGDGKNLPEEMIINQANQHPVGRQMLDIIGLTNRYSILMMRLIVDKKEVKVKSPKAKTKVSTSNCPAFAQTH